MSQQQTVLRVQSNQPDLPGGITQYEFLDLYSSIPIKLNISFAELQDIGSKNSDYSLGLQIPGSKKNNRFFESFFNVDSQSLYFDVNKRVNCDVLLGDEQLFKGFLKLNKVSVLNSKVEYDVTLFSIMSDLFGNMGNKLLKDLNFNDPEYTFNHTFNLTGVTQQFTTSNFGKDSEKPYPYFYPVIHNGYEYSGKTVNFSGTPVNDQTRFYSSTSPIFAYSSQAAAWADGVEQFHINSPGQGLIDNQLKPALSMWSLMQLMFKQAGYTIKSDFFNTPWMKSLYMYGYFSSSLTKFSYTMYEIPELPIEGVEIIYEYDGTVLNVYVCKLGTGTPVYCTVDIPFEYLYIDGYFQVSGTTIPYGTSGVTVNVNGLLALDFKDVPTAAFSTLKYFPVAVGDSVAFMDGDPVNFNLVIDDSIKQIDIIASLARKFNLVFIPDSEVTNQLIIEPYDYYVGSGVIYDWTPKLSYDKGWSVQPALDFIESTLKLTDQEDGDWGNKEFKDKNNRIYGRMLFNGPTSFKSSEKVIDTIYSPFIIRKWDRDNVDNIGLPLAVSYVASNEPDPDNAAAPTIWKYTGVKTKPKLFYWMGTANPFLDSIGEHNNAEYYWSSYTAWVCNSATTSVLKLNSLPVVSHTMPMGLADEYKINNDSLCVLFNSEKPVDTPNDILFNTYTENDAFSRFYNNRIDNIYSPNTRFLSGYFNLKYSDVKNLKPNDVIKIQEQYFTLNKISEFNLTNRELTQVELVQFNGITSTYPDRYFQYSYCDRPNVIYKFKTNFTDPNLLDTNYGWSVYYDNKVGTLVSNGFASTGFTAVFLDYQDGEFKYIPYTMYEVDETTYNTTGINWTTDTLRNYIYSEAGAPFGTAMPTIWNNSDVTTNGINLFENCTDFDFAAAGYGIAVGSSTYHD